MISASDARVQLQYAVEQFLYAEAALIDDRRFPEWLEWLADDLEYWMPIRTTRMQNDVQNEFTAFGEGALFDDDKESMAQRVRKLYTGYAWAEDPPSRTRHAIFNVRVRGEPGGDVDVDCNFFLYRSRLADDADFWSGRREDRLRPGGPGGFQVCRRHIFLDHVSLNSKNLSVFF